MADYFTNFSMILPLPSAEAQQYADDLAQQALNIRRDDEAMPDDFPESLKEVVDDWCFETEANHPSNGPGLWLHSSDGGIDAVCAFIQHLLQKFDPQGHVALEWSNDCSKPRVDAFGGGAALITARKIKSINTGQWLHRQTTRLQKQQPTTEGATP